MLKKKKSLINGIVLILVIMLMASPIQTGIVHSQTGTITKVTVVQALGNQSNKFVAGKNTAVLVYMSQPMAVAPDQQKVDVQLGGATVATLQPSSSDQPVNPLAFVCPSRAACGDWKAGEYTFAVTIGDATSEARATLQERKGLKILAVPVKGNYGAGDVRSVTGTWRTMSEFVRAIYPLSPDRFEVTLGQEVDASADKYNLKTDDGQAEMFGEVVKLQPKECFEKPLPPNVAGCYDKVVAFVKDRMGAEGTLQGFTMGYNTNIVVETDEDAAATVAHEIGHNYSLGDEYQGGQFNCDVNPPPATFVGKDFNNSETQNYSCQKSALPQFEQAGASAIKADTDIPYEIGGRGLLPDMASFMGSGAPQNRNWISSASWSKIFDGLAPIATGGIYNPKDAINASYILNALTSRPSAALFAGPAAPAKQQGARWIYAQGYIGSDGKVELEPWYDYESNDTPGPESAGSGYSLHALDSADKSLASAPIDVDFTVIDNPKPLDKALFETVMPFPEGTTHFQILKDTQVLETVPVSANAPTVEITAPAAGETITGDKYTVKWNGADADNDKLLYDVEYSTDGQDWELIDSELDATQTEIDLGDLPGSDKPTAHIRVTVTDGVNATEAVSEAFTIAPRAPEAVIETPEKEATYAVGAPISLEGVGYDLQDEDLTGIDQLTWTSDVQGELGKGDMLVLTNLKPGKHTITLKATNSYNVSGSAQMVVNIEQSKPAFGTAAPAITAAAPGQETPTTAAVPPTQIESAPSPAAVSTPTAASAGGGTSTQTGSSNNSGSPVLWIVLGIVVVAVLVVGGVLMTRRRPTV